MKTLLIITNVDWFLISHRLVIAKAAVKRGWKVYVACENTGRADEISVDGIEFIDFKFSRSGTNPLEELRTINDFKKLYRRLKPDIVHQITLKPVVYGTYAGKSVGIKGIVNAISGLGYTFTNGRMGIVQKLILKLMRYSFKRSNLSVIFQNNDDREVLENFSVIDPRNSLYLIKGSGVDLNQFEFSELPSFDKIKILFPARMLWDKGIKELKEASNYLKEKYHNKVQFILAGLADEANKASVSASYLNSWQDGEYIQWLGHQSDMVSLYRDCHIVVLPSYREGLPKTLIEACAIGRAIVTTDAVGCKDCVDEGINGFKVPVYAVEELASALEKLILNPELLIKMGHASRKKAEQEFDVENVVAKHLEIYNDLYRSGNL